MSKTEPRFDKDKCAEVADQTSKALLRLWAISEHSPFCVALKKGLTIKIIRILSKMSTFTQTQDMKNSKLKGCSIAEHKAYIRVAKQAHEESQMTLGMIIADELCGFHEMHLKNSKGLLCEYYALAANFDALLAPEKLLEKTEKALSGSTKKSPKTSMKNKLTVTSPEDVKPQIEPATAGTGVGDPPSSKELNEDTL